MSELRASYLYRLGDPGPTDEQLIEAYGRLQSVHKVGAELGLNFASVASRLHKAGVPLPRQGKRGKRLANPMQQPEREFQANVVQLATWLKWKTYHTWISIHSANGFPDLVLVRKPRVIFAELKAENGYVKPTQEDWLEELRGCPGVETYLWRPSDIEKITEVLR